MIWIINVVRLTGIFFCGVPKPWQHPRVQLRQFSCFTSKRPQRRPQWDIRTVLQSCGVISLCRSCCCYVRPLHTDFVLLDTVLSFRILWRNCKYRLLCFGAWRQQLSKKTLKNLGRVRLLLNYYERLIFMDILAFHRIFPVTDIFFVILTINFCAWTW